MFVVDDDDDVIVICMYPSYYYGWMDVVITSNIHTKSIVHHQFVRDFCHSFSFSFSLSITFVKVLFGFYFHTQKNLTIIDNQQQKKCKVKSIPG